MQVALAGADEGCVGSALDCAAESALGWLSWGILALVVGGGIGLLLAVVGHLTLRAVDDDAPRGPGPGVPGAAARAFLPARGGRPGHPPTALRFGWQPAPMRVITGPVWSDGHWLRVVAAARGGRRIEVLGTEGWTATDQHVGELVAEAWSTRLDAR